MAWLKRPRVLLGVGFNAVYLTYYALSGAPDGRPVVRRAPITAEPNVVSYYSPQVKQTNVYPTEDLILVREPGRTLVFSPIISLPGAGAAEPSSVHFRFYSFSGARQYDAARGLRLTVDGEEIWSGADVIYSWNAGARGEVVESLGGQVPSGEFIRAVEGRVLKITVGREEIELSWGQRRALLRMLECARAGRCG